MTKLIIKTGTKILLLYCLWLLLFKGLNYLLPSYSRFISEFYNIILNNLLYTTKFVVENLTNIAVTLKKDTMFYYMHSCMKITEECLGVKFISIFIIIIIALPGAKVKNKLWYIPMGIIVLHLLNILRMIVLSLTIIYTNYFNFMHGFVFRVILYGAIFGLWFIWVNYFIDQQKIRDEIIKTA